MRLSQTQVINRLIYYYPFINAAFRSPRINFEKDLISAGIIKHECVKTSQLFKEWVRKQDLKYQRQINSFSTQFRDALDPSLHRVVQRIRNLTDYKIQLEEERRHCLSKINFSLYYQPQHSPRFLHTDSPIHARGRDSSPPREKNLQKELEELNHEILLTNLSISNILKKTQAAYDEFEIFIKAIQLARDTSNVEPLSQFLQKHAAVEHLLIEDFDNIRKVANLWLFSYLQNLFIDEEHHKSTQEIQSNPLSTISR